jgi:dTMP kinase
LNRPGIFISFEGIDGSGKTTQLELLRESLTQAGHAVVVAREPGGTRVGREIRRLLLDAANHDLRPTAELLLYFASRAQNIAEVIRPALEAGSVVLSDRFTDATVAYQGHGRGLGVENVRAIEQVACGGMKPDLTLLLDIDPEVGVKRALDRNHALKRAGEAADESRMERESREFFERVAAGYRALHAAEPRRIVRIDGRAPAAEVARAVRAAVARRFESLG